ncbi:MAG: hypothetical protein N3D16_10470 [Anaerolineales bacterium]|nr:hypothetical protein [Anaerolineales bacterium]
MKEPYKTKILLEKENHHEGDTEEGSGDSSCEHFKNGKTMLKQPDFAFVAAMFPPPKKIYFTLQGVCQSLVLAAMAGRARPHRLQFNSAGLRRTPASDKRWLAGFYLQKKLFATIL